MNKIIVMFGDLDKELNMSLYDFVAEQYRHANPLLACHVTEEEYKIMLEQIKHGGLDERFPIIYKESLEYDKFRYLLAYDYVHNNICIANYENFEQKGNYAITSEGLLYNKNGLQFPEDPILSRCISWRIKVYTTETYEDVINYYSSH